MSTADAIARTLGSPNECDSNLENANVVDVLSSLSRSTRQIANAITPMGVAGGSDGCGNHVESLTEAVMGITDGLIRVADSISELAEAVRRVP